MPRYLIPVLVLALLLAVVGAAASVAQPTVAVEGVQVGTLTPANTNLQVQVRVANPNVFDIPLKDVAFTVHSVESTGLRQLGAGQTGAFVLPAGQTNGRTVPVTLDNRALLEAALTAIRAGQDRLTFRVIGTVSGDVYGLATVNVPFEQDQTVTLRELLGMTGVRVDEATIRRALGAAQAIAIGGVPGITVRMG